MIKKIKGFLRKDSESKEDRSVAYKQMYQFTPKPFPELTDLIPLSNESDGHDASQCTFSELITNTVSPNVSVHLDQIADLSLQGVFAVSDPPQISGAMVFDDGFGNQCGINGSFLDITAASDQGVGNTVGSIILNGTTPSGASQIGEIDFGFSNETTGQLSGFINFQIFNNGTLNSLFDIRGYDGTSGARATFGSAITNVGIGFDYTTSCEPSALLQINSVTQGFLKSRMTAIDMVNILSPAEGLEVYNYDAHAPYFFNGAGWVPSDGASITILGTTNQVDVILSGSTYTLSTPQDINTSAIPYFSGMGLGFSSGINPTAILQLNSTTQGFQPPQMTTVQMNDIPITAAAAGLTVYVTDGAQGQYICDGTSWDLTGGGDTGGSLQSSYLIGNTIALSTSRPVVISTQGATSNFSVYSNSTSSYTYDSIEGEEFTLTTDRFVTALYYADINFTGGSREVGIYRVSDQVLITSALVDKTDPLDGTGTFRSHAITPILLTAATQYLCVAIVPANELWAFYARAGVTPYYYTGITYGQATSSLVYPTTIYPTSNLVYYGNQSFQSTPVSSSVAINDSTANSIFTITSTQQGSTPWPLQSTTQFSALTLSKGLSAFDNVLNRPTLYDGSTIQTLAYVSDLLGTAGGDLSGTYPNPTVAQINGVALGSTTATSGNILIGSGTQWVSHTMSGNVTMNSTGVTTIGATQVTNGMLAGSIDLTAKVTGTLPFANGGLGLSTATTGDLFYCSFTNLAGKISAVATGQVLASAGTGVAPAYTATPTLTSVTATTFTGALSGNATTATTATNSTNVATTQVASNIPYYLLMVSSSTNSNQAVDLASGLTYNASTNILSLNAITLTNAGGQSLQMANTGEIAAKNTTGSYENAIYPRYSDNAMYLSGGAGGMFLRINNTTNAIVIDASANVAVSAGNFLINTATAGLQQKHVAVSAGTANSYLVTGVVLSSGASGTINNSIVTTSHIGFATRTTVSGTPSFITVTTGSASFTVTGGSLDNSTYAVMFVLPT